MDISNIADTIATLGFPIVTTLFLAWFIWKIWIKQQEQNEKREEKLYSFIGEGQKVNEKLTKTNGEFVAILNSYKSDLEEIKEDVTEIKNNMKG